MDGTRLHKTDCIVSLVFVFRWRFLGSLVQIALHSFSESQIAESLTDMSTLACDRLYDSIAAVRAGQYKELALSLWLVTVFRT